MFWKRNERKWSKSGFAIMLAEELTRAALYEIYDGQNVTIMQRDICAEPESECLASERHPFDVGGPIRDYDMHFTDRRGQPPTITDIEMQLGKNAPSKERYVRINAVLGPITEEHYLQERFPEIEATCRLFSVNGGCTMWQPHYLHVKIGETIHEFYYVPG